MTQSKLGELILQELFNAAEEQGYGKHFEINQIANHFKENDLFKIRNVANYLKDRDLINAIFMGGGKILGKISSDGIALVERGGETGVIQEYENSPEKFILVDNSVHYYGDITQSNISTNSNNPNQRIENSTNQLLEKIVEILKTNQELPKEIIEDALTDIELIKLQLSKNSPDKGIIKKVLRCLEDILPITPYILQLTSALL